MKEKRILNTHGLVCVIIGLASTFALIPSAYASPPDSCLAYAYSGEDDYSFLVRENTTIFGERMVVIHNCDFVELLSDGNFIQGSYTNFTIPVDNGIRNYTINGYVNDTIVFNENINNVEAFSLEMNFKEFFGITEFEIQEYVNSKEINRLQNISAIGTAFVIWLVCVNVYWRLINHYIDRNFFEEVV